jgi:hypothetical protein
MDRADNADGFDGAPKPGDATICFKCGAMLKFGEGLKVRLLSFLEFCREPEAMRDMLVRLQRETRAYQASKQ